MDRVYWVSSNMDIVYWVSLNMEIVYWVPSNMGRVYWVSQSWIEYTGGPNYGESILGVSTMDKVCGVSQPWT